MQRSRSDSSSGKIFNGVRFFLFGFDPASEAQYRSEIVRRGGIDVGRYDASCTHVIVSSCVYDDPVCVAARQDGKVLVTELWIDDCVDLGALADASRVIYRPVKDLNGIPGSESLYICLTGYQREDRDDIMKMVSLMGAQFSKPLIANKVTHLICYKFEGEKYELAKKVKIKLVNHRWLVDCLKAWEILPIDNYTKSGWELEVLEAEARDSEEEGEDPGTELLGQRRTTGTPYLQGKNHIASSSHLCTPNREVSVIHKDPSSANLQLCDEKPLINQKLFPTPCKETNLNRNPEASLQNLDTFREKEPSIPSDVRLKGKNNALSSDMGSSASKLDERFTTISYSRKSLKEDGSKENQLSSCIVDSKINISNDDHDISKGEETNDKPDHPKRKASDSSTGKKSPKLFSMQSPSTNMAPLEPTSAVSINQSHANANNHFEGYAETNSIDKQHAALSKFSLSYKKRSLKRGQATSEAINSISADSPLIVSAHMAKPSEFFIKPIEFSNQLPISETKCFSVEEKEAMDVENLEKTAVGLNNKSKNVKHSNEKAKEAFNAINEPDLVDDPENGGDIKMKDISKSISDENGEPRSISKSLSPNSKDLETRKLSINSNKESLAVRTKKVVSRKNLSSKSKLSMINTSKNNVVNTSDEVTTSTATEVKTGNSKKLKTGATDLVDKFENGGDVITKDASKSVSDEITEPRSISKSIASNSKDSKIKLASNINEEPSNVHTKKVVSRRNLSSKSKLNTNNSGTESVVNATDKVTPSTRTEVITGKTENLKTKVTPEKSTSKGKKKKDESASKDVVMEDKLKPKETRNKKKVINQVEASMDPEKENKLNKNVAMSLNANSHPNSKNSRQNSKGVGVVKSNGEQAMSCERLVKPDPVWFILSGHRFQRKEYQNVIRRLKGRVCRDSHNWNYQATHFIVPDPVRRTEKFFAAAAAGRWILKTDYLTESNAAGNFLDEEPFEWYSKGLTEDGAISLEAPRKWRRLRERTGHGALYKMRIVVYGECIAPSLETLKRVVKAGDGTILATSPPYTRFLKTGIDFAIISPSMPRVDSWVQEFLRHEIPCVVADYLVEYVCKPAYPLDRHVLYNTNSWAEKSFTNLLNQSEEIVIEESSDDISCSVCGSRDRGDVMLMCGDENGTNGCGIGTHIDCCDPPLENVPEGDWFCSNCRKESSPKSQLKSRKKKTCSRCK